MPYPAITAFSGRVGIARRDITPPIGINAKNWGTAAHEVATGIHRPLTCSVISICTEASDTPLLLAALDLGWFKSPTDELLLRQPLLDHFAIDPARIVINLSHTHAGPSICIDDANRPGGDLIRPYLAHVAQALVEAAREAFNTMQPAVIDWKYGACTLATNRDLPDPADPSRLLVGYNPGAPVDTTLLIGRITASDRSLLGTIVNYACHPTTLAWENSLISPDYVGAMREEIERSTAAPCVFLQGASGDIAPAHQYTGDCSVADRHGLSVAHAALATLNTMPPPGQELDYAGVVQSGATLAHWTLRQQQTDASLEAVVIQLPLPLKPQPSLNELHDALAQTNDKVMMERLRRRISIVRFVGSEPVREMPAWIWRIGGVLLFAQPNELYSKWQIALRQQWPGRPVIAMNLSNGSCGYVLPKDQCNDALYAFWQSPFDRGAYEIVESLTIEYGRRLIAGGH